MLFGREKSPFTHNSHVAAAGADVAVGVADVFAVDLGAPVELVVYLLFDPSYNEVLYFPPLIPLDKEKKGQIVVEPELCH